MRRAARLPLEDPGAPDRIHVIGCPLRTRIAGRRALVYISVRAADIVLALIVGGLGGVLLYVILQLA